MSKKRKTFSRFFLQGKKPAPPPKDAAPTPPNPGSKIMTKAELSEYDGSDESKGIYLALLGQIYDVSKGKDYYAKGGGYGFFSGR